MSKKIILTNHQYEAVIRDYFANKALRKRLEKSDVEALASKLNEKINIPFFFSEEKEKTVLIKIVTQVDSFLYDHLPNEIYDSIRHAKDGAISDDVAKQLITRLSTLANKKIDIPYLPEKIEYLAVNFILSILVNAMRKNWSLSKTLDQSQAITVPTMNSEEDFEVL